MIAEEVPESCTANSKYQIQFYTVATILERVIDCFHTIVTDETNPYHPPLGWLTRKQPRPPREELFFDLFEECSQEIVKNNAADDNLNRQIDENRFNQGGPKSRYPSVSSVVLSSSLQSRIEKSPLNIRRSICSQTKDGCTSFFKACRLGHLNIVKYLIDNCDPDIEQEGVYEAIEDHHTHSVSPLWVSAVSGYIDIVELLIQNGADVNSVSDTGSTPLRSVCFKCQDDDNLSNAFTDRSSETLQADAPLGFSEPDGNDVFFDIMKVLINHGANINKPNYNGGTCLINSIHNYRAVEYLLAHGAKINSSDPFSRTALHYAIQQGRINVTKLLLSKGADPMSKTNYSDDALQLSCLAANEDTFLHLTNAIRYPRKRLIDAYKLLGSSLLELRNDRSRARQWWALALAHQNIGEDSNGLENNIEQESDHSPILVCDEATSSDHHLDNPFSGIINCDKRRVMAYGEDAIELTHPSQLDGLSDEEFRIQSLIMAERVLGTNHREFIERLLYRGTYYVNILRPKRCVDLWTYALKLRLKHESIFHLESIFATQALTKLFLDMLNQGLELHFEDVYDVLQLLASQLSDCRRLLNLRPSYRLHDEIHDLLLDIIIDLLLVLLHTSNKGHSHLTQTQNIGNTTRDDRNRVNGSQSNRLHTSMARHRKYTTSDDERILVCHFIGQLVDLGPRNSRGCNLLHISLQPSAVCVESRSVAARDRLRQLSPELNSATLLPELVELLLESGLPVDDTNSAGLTALQQLCLASGLRSVDRKPLVELLIGAGAHVDRRGPVGDHQRETILRELRDCGVDPMHHTTLACLAARSLASSRIDSTPLTPSLRGFTAIH